MKSKKCSIKLKHKVQEIREYFIDEIQVFLSLRIHTTPNDTNS